MKHRSIGIAIGAGVLAFAGCGGSESSSDASSATSGSSTPTAVVTASTAPEITPETSAPESAPETTAPETTSSEEPSSATGLAHEEFAAQSNAVCRTVNPKIRKLVVRFGRAKAEEQRRIAKQIGDLSAERWDTITALKPREFSDRRLIVQIQTYPFELNRTIASGNREAERLLKDRFNAALVEADLTDCAVG